jgi:hypothetical protein
MSTSVRGACLCGEVRFEVMLPSKWVAHCHCSMCRRAHGAGFVTWVSVPDEQLAMHDQTSLRTHASSADGRRSFCGTCGSPLFFRSSRWPGETHIALASLEGPVDRPPAVHAFWSDRAPWTVMHDGLPRRGGVSGLEPLPPEEI